MGGTTEENLASLASLSNRYGADPDFTLYGGGNSSYKDEKTLYIKPSGSRLGDITPEGFCALDREALSTLAGEELEGSDVSVEALARERTLRARVPGEDRIPSVETLLHTVFPQRFVMHLHPALLNGMTCARQGEVTARILYGGEALWVPESAPGYALARQVASDMKTFREQKGHDCALVFLQNHGIFAAADDTAVIDKLLTLITQAAARFTPTAPAMGSPSAPPEELKKIAGEFALLDNSPAAVASVGHPDFERMTTLTPDHMTLCGDLLLKTDREHLPEDLNRYIKERGEAPRLVGLAREGILACGATAEKSREIMDLFHDAFRIVCYAEGSGGVRFMSTFLVKTLLKRQKSQ